MIDSSNEGDDLRAAAIVCAHAADGDPFLIAERGEPEDPDDSGWQFLCGASAEDWQMARVWSLQEVVQIEPSLMRFLSFPARTRLVRASPQAAWEIVPVDGDQNATSS